MVIYFIRHPETIWNEKGLFQGIKESSLSHLGYLTTRDFVEKSKKNKIDSIYYADNNRCKYLADELLKIHTEAKAKKDVRLNERSFGEYEGFSEKDSAKVSSFNPEDFMKKFIWKPLGGESLKGIVPRVKGFLIDIKKVEKKGNVVFVITSGGVIRVALTILGMKTLKEAMIYKAKNLEIVEVNLLYTRFKFSLN